MHSFTPTRVATLRTQPEKTSCIPAAAKSVWIVQGQNVGQRNQCSHTFHLFQQSNFDALPWRFARSADRIPRCARSTIRFPQQRIQGIPQLLAQSLGDLSIHLFRAALPQPLSVRFRQPSRGIHQRFSIPTSAARARITVRWICALALRCRTGPNKPGSILASRASVRASSRSSFSTTLPDQSHVPRMRHDHFMSQLGQLPAYPGRMRPGFQRDPAARNFIRQILVGLSALLARSALESRTPASSNMQ